MGLKLSVYDGGERSVNCEICGKPLKYTWRSRQIKCLNCAQKIADDVSRDFKENIGHHTTEALMAAAGDAIIDWMRTPVTITNEEEDEE